MAEIPVINIEYPLAPQTFLAEDQTEISITENSYSVKIDKSDDGENITLTARVYQNGQEIDSLIIGTQAFKYDWYILDGTDDTEWQQFAADSKYIIVPKLELNEVVSYKCLVSEK